MYQPEDLEQKYLIDWTKLEEHKYPELRWLYAIPNGGKRDYSTACRLKATGVKSGVPDLCLPVPLKPYHGLYVEMKVKGNTTSPPQKEWIAHLKSAGYKTAVCYGMGEAIDVIKEYLKLPAWGKGGQV